MIAYHYLIALFYLVQFSTIKLVICIYVSIHGLLISYIHQTSLVQYIIYLKLKCLILQMCNATLTHGMLRRGIFIMKFEDIFDLQCKICYLEFDEFRCIPHIICRNFHLACSNCIRNIYQRRMVDYYDCPFCKAPTTYTSALEFKKLLNLKKLIRKLIKPKENNQTKLIIEIEMEKNKRLLSNIEHEKELSKCEGQLFKAIEKIQNLTKNNEKIKFELNTAFKKMSAQYEEQIQRLRYAQGNDNSIKSAMFLKLSNLQSVNQKLKEEIKALVVKFEQIALQKGNIKKENEQIKIQKVKAEERCQQYRWQNLKLYEKIKSLNEIMIKNNLADQLFDKNMASRNKEVVEKSNYTSQTKIRKTKNEKPIKIKIVKQVNLDKYQIVKNNREEKISNNENFPHEE